MKYQHKDLALGRWRQLSFLEQMANIGSEVNRALNWQVKDNRAYSVRAVERALELIDLTLEDTKGLARLKELSRIREAIVDYFFGENEYHSTEAVLRRYFLAFACAVRKHN